MNSIQNVDGGLCTGCGACFAVCPKNAIEMRRDEKGFQKPAVDPELCVSCGRCVSVCGVGKSAEEPKDRIREYYAVINPDGKIRQDSTSGGAFTLLAKAVLAAGGAVCGAAYDEEMKVRHIFVQEEGLLGKLRGSKYVQSNIEQCFHPIEEFLNEGREMLFTGTPCQISAVLNYLKVKRIDTSRLYTADILCHGVPSPGLWDDFLKYVKENNHSEIETYEFRSGTCGWHHIIPKAVLKNKKTLINCLSADGFPNLFYRSLSLRDSCYSCGYASYDRVSDITLGDFWNIEKYYPQYDDNQGTSLVMVNTAKGKALFSRIPQPSVKTAANQKQIEQKALIAPAKRKTDRDQFWKEYRDKGFAYVLEKYGSETKNRRAKRSFMIVLHKIGLLSAMRKILHIEG